MMADERRTIKGIHTYVGRSASPPVPYTYLRASHCLSEVAGQLVFGTKNLRMAKSRQAVIYLVLPSSSYAASKIQLQTGQINQCTQPMSQNGTVRCVKCIFGTRELFRFLAHLAEHFSWGFPSPSLNRAILSAKIYDTFVGSILAKSYRNFCFSLVPGQLFPWCHHHRLAVHLFSA